MYFPNDKGCIQPFHKLDTSHSSNYTLYLFSLEIKLNVMLFRNGRNKIPHNSKIDFSRKQNVLAKFDGYMFKATL